MPDGNGTLASLGSRDMAINDTGQVLIGAGAEGSLMGGLDASALLLADVSSAKVLLREGESAPNEAGIPNGVFESFLELALDETGVAVVRANLRDTSGGDGVDDNGLFMTNGIDTIQIVRKGDSVLGSTVNTIEFQGENEDFGHERNGLNDAGQVVYEVTLADGTNVLRVFSLVQEVHWEAVGGGNWFTDSNWTLDTEPDSLRHTFIDPEVGLTVTGNFVSSAVKSLTVGATALGQAVLDLSNGGDLLSLGAITINERGKINVGPGRVLSGPTLDNAGVVSGGGQVDAVFSNLAAGQVRVETGSALTFAGTSNSNAGTVDVIGGQVDFREGLVNEAGTGLVFAQDALLRFGTGLMNEGSVAVSFGTTTVFGDVTMVDEGRVVVTGGANVTFIDDIDFAEGSTGFIQVDTGATAVIFGAVTGDASFPGFGTVFLAGDLKPGLSPGVSAFGGDVQLGSTAELVIELADAAHDRLVVGGAMAAGGALRVELLGGFEPGLGDAFDLLDFGSVSGGFAALDLPGLRHGLSFDASGLLTDGTLVVVPEPGVGVVAGVGGIVGMALSGRRARRMG